MADESDATLSVFVNLPSGRGVRVSVPHRSTISELQVAAQRSLRQGFLRHLLHCCNFSETTYCVKRVAEKPIVVQQGPFLFVY